MTEQGVYLITGGTGSLGTQLTHHLIQAGNKVRVYARNEHGHECLLNSLPENKRHLLSCLIGAVEDEHRLRVALRGVDYVVHAAALKIVGLAEYNPGECVKTNVLGTQNLIDAILTSGVKRAAFVSSDKACASVNHYGHTKAVGEKLWLHANSYRADDKPFVAVRYGNCWNSKGSVIQSFKAQLPSGRLTLTNRQCTRFHWKLEEAREFVLNALHHAQPGEMWIPKIRSYTLRDLAVAFMDVHTMRRPFEEIGLRPGEKLHESMISVDEVFMSRDDGTRYILTPGMAQECHTKEFTVEGYTSGTNRHRVGREELMELVRETA